MLRTIVFVLSATLFASSAYAQSTLTLDDFNLSDGKNKPSDTAAPAKSPRGNALEACLSDAANCKDESLKSSTDFSIDDVVNLGIIDREEIKVSKVSSSSGDNPKEQQSLPSIDMEILFDYDSDKIRSDQFQKLFELSNVLKGSKFDKFKFAFLGHSDAKGEPSYNQDLSFRRAAAVSQFIVSAASVENYRVIARGMGSSMLKTPGDSFGSANRRVQLVLIPVK